MNFSSRCLDIMSNHEKGTCEWFLTQSEFQDWIAGKSKTLFCRGMPGAGKSVIAAVVEGYLRNKFAQDDVAVTCVFCNRQESAGIYSQSTTNLLGSIIRQFGLDKNNHLVDLQDLRVRFRDRTRDSLNKEFRLFLQTMVSEYKRVFCVVDGLDECEPEIREELVEILSHLNPQVNLLFTSRDISDFEMDLPKLVISEVDAKPRDLSIYVDARIRSSNTLKKHLHGDASLRRKLEESIMATSQGM